jgi:hypothetical protein
VDPVARLIWEADAIGEEVGLAREKVLELASYIPPGNGREAASFEDPRRPGIGEEWIRATLRELPALRRRLKRAPPL